MIHQTASTCSSDVCIPIERAGIAGGSAIQRFRSALRTGKPRSRHRGCTRAVRRALNLFRSGAGRIAERDLPLAQAMADIAAISLLQERAVPQSRDGVSELQRALSSRVVIPAGLAKARFLRRQNAASACLRGGGNAEVLGAPRMQDGTLERPAPIGPSRSSRCPELRLGDTQPRVHDQAAEETPASLRRPQRFAM